MNDSVDCSRNTVFKEITVTFNTRLKYKKPSYLVYAKYNEESFLHYVHNNYFISR